VTQTNEILVGLAGLRWLAELRPPCSDIVVEGSLGLAGDASIIDVIENLEVAHV